MEFVFRVQDLLAVPGECDYGCLQFLVVYLYIYIYICAFSLQNSFSICYLNICHLHVCESFFSCARASLARASDEEFFSRYACA